MDLKRLSAKWQPFCSGGDELTSFVKEATDHANISWALHGPVSFSVLGSPQPGLTTLGTIKT